MSCGDKGTLCDSCIKRPETANGAQGRQIFALKNDAKSLIYKAYNFLILPVNRKSVYPYV